MDNLISIQTTDEYNKYYTRTFKEIIDQIHKYHSKWKIKNKKTIDNFNTAKEYIINHNKTLNASKTNLLWINHSFSKSFWTSAEMYLDTPSFLGIILPILFGNFANIKRPTIIEEKLFCMFTLPFGNKNNKIVFSIYFKLSSEGFAKQTLKFIGFTNDDISFNDIFGVYKLRVLNSNKYPSIPYDIISISKKHEILFSEVKKLSDNLKIFHPLEKEIRLERSAFRKVIVHDYTVNIGNNPLDFNLSSLNESIMKTYDSLSYHSVIRDVLHSDKWRYQWSNQELFLIYNPKPFILSGQPGTGKTTVVLAKMFSCFFNFHIWKSIESSGNDSVPDEIDWKKIRRNIKDTDISNQFKIVFTSFSDVLCVKCQDIFIQQIKKCKFDINERDFQLNREKYKSISSLRDIPIYPIFVNFRKLMFLIDGSITFQFFHRLNNRKFQTLDNNCEINYINNYEYKINNYLRMRFSVDNFDNNSAFYGNPEVNEAENTITMKEMSFEIFEAFYNNLKMGGGWGNIKVSQKQNCNYNLTREIKRRVQSQSKTINLNVAEIYSKIISIIKGSLLSYLSETNCITRNEFKNKGEKWLELSDDQRDYIYDVCIWYEEYKAKHHYFDIQDITNHLIRQVKLELGDIKWIDFLFFDEIQDLTINQIYLLVLVTRYPRVYAGDTCQTISSINRFRFTDLNNLFFTFQQVIKNFTKVENAVWNWNYRWNSHIWKWATFFSKWIREWFKNTVDNWKEDYSLKIIPFKPALLCDFNTIYNWINNEGINKLTFAFYTCFISRTKEKAQMWGKTNAKEGEILSWSIEECKGWEYEIVVVYNFFTDSPYKKIWSELFRRMKTKKGTNGDINWLKNKLNAEDWNGILKNYIVYYPEDIGKYKENWTEGCKDKIVYENSDFVFPELCWDNWDTHKYFEFCSEIKQFYVLISRAETFWLFYEEDKNCPCYDFLLNEKWIIFDDNLVKKQMVKYYSDSSFRIVDDEQFEKLAKEKYKKGHLTEAWFYFRKIGRDDKACKCEIFIQYAQLQELENSYFKKESKIKEWSEEILNWTSWLNGKGKFKYSKTKNAEVQGKCLYNTKKYDAAIEVYDQAKLYDKSAKIHFQKGNYKEAFTYYKRYGNYTFAIWMLIKSKEYIELLQYINEISDNWNILEYTSYYKNNINNYWLNIIPEIKTITTFDLNETIRTTTTTSITSNRNRKQEIRCFFSDYLTILNNKLGIFRKRSQGYSYFSSEMYGYTSTIEGELQKEIVSDNEILQVINDFKSDPNIAWYFDCYFLNDVPSIILTMVNQVPSWYALKLTSFPLESYISSLITHPENKKNKCHYFSNWNNRWFKELDTFFSEMGNETLQLKKHNQIKELMLLHCCYDSEYISDPLWVRWWTLNQEIVITSNSFSIHQNIWNNLYNMKILINKYNTWSKLRGFAWSDCDYSDVYEIIGLFANENNIFIGYDIGKKIKEFKDIVEQPSKCLNDYTKGFRIGTAISLFLVLTNEKLKQKISFKFYQVIKLMLKLTEWLRFLDTFRVNNVHEVEDPEYKVLLMFSLFNAFSISYFPHFNDKTMHECNEFAVYQNMNFCILNRDSPLFTYEFNQKHPNEIILGWFDRTGNNFVISIKKAIEILRLTIISISKNCQFDANAAKTQEIRQFVFKEIQARILSNGYFIQQFTELQNNSGPRRNHTFEQIFSYYFSQKFSQIWKTHETWLSDLLKIIIRDIVQYKKEMNDYNISSFAFVFELFVGQLFDYDHHYNALYYKSVDGLLNCNTYQYMPKLLLWPWIKNVLFYIIIACAKYEGISHSAGFVIYDYDDIVTIRKDNTNYGSTDIEFNIFLMNFLTIIYNVTDINREYTESKILYQNIKWLQRRYKGCYVGKYYADKRKKVHRHLNKLRIELKKRISLNWFILKHVFLIYINMKSYLKLSRKKINENIFLMKMNEFVKFYETNYNLLQLKNEGEYQWWSFKKYYGKNKSVGIVERSCEDVCLVRLPEWKTMKVYNSFWDTKVCEERFKDEYDFWFSRVSNPQVYSKMWEWEINNVKCGYKLFQDVRLKEKEKIRLRIEEEDDDEIIINDDEIIINDDEIIFDDY